MNENEYTHISLHRRAAEYYRSVRLQGSPQSLSEIEPQIFEFHHLIEAEEYDNAVDLLTDIGEQYLTRWGYFERIVKMRQALIDKIRDPNGDIENLISLADVYRMMGRTAESIEYGLRSLELATRQENISLQAKALTLLGGIYRRQGEVSKSLEYLQKSLPLARQSKQVDVELQTLLQMSHVYTYIGRTEEAADRLKAAIRLADKEMRNAKKGDLQGQLGYTDLWFGYLGNAIDNFSAALEIAEQEKNRRGKGYWHLALGESYMLKGNYISAEQHFTSAIMIAVEISDNHLNSYASSFLAQTFLLAGQIEDAHKHILKARNFDNPQHNDFKAMLHALIVFLQHDLPQSKKLLNEALNISDQLLEKSPDFLEARCNRGLIYLLLALNSGFVDITPDLLLKSRSDFSSVFGGTTAQGVFDRYMQILDLVRSEDKLNFIELVFDGVKETMQKIIEKNGLFVELHVPDFNKAIEFYSKLGFVVAIRVEETDKYLTMRRGNTIINFFQGEDGVQAHPYFKRFPENTTYGYGVEVVIPTPQITDFYKEVSNTLPIDAIVEPLKKQPWGKLDFRVADPFGIYLRFTETLQWLQLE